MDPQDPVPVLHDRLEALPRLGLIPAEGRDPALQFELLLEGGQGLDFIEPAAQVGVPLEQARTVDPELLGLGHRSGRSYGR